MKYTVKLAKAKMEKEFGSMVLEVQEMCESDMTLSMVSQRAFSALEAKGFASIGTPAPGWKPLVYVDHQKMMAAGLIKSWDVK